MNWLTKRIEELEDELEGTLPLCNMDFYGIEEEEEIDTFPYDKVEFLKGEIKRLKALKKGDRP